MLESTSVTARPLSWNNVPSELDCPVPARGVGSQANRIVLLRIAQGPGPSPLIFRDHPLVLRMTLFSNTPSGDAMLTAAPEALRKRQLRTVMARPPRRSTRVARGELRTSKAPP